MLDELLLWLSGALVVWLALHSSPSHAETQAEKVFGKWERVTVAEILKPVPEVENEKSSRAGSVTNEYRRQVPVAVQVHSFQRSYPAQYVRPSK